MYYNLFSLFDLFRVVLVTTVVFQCFVCGDMVHPKPTRNESKVEIEPEPCKPDFEYYKIPAPGWIN